MGMDTATASQAALLTDAIASSQERGARAAAPIDAKPPGAALGRAEEVSTVHEITHQRERHDRLWGVAEARDGAARGDLFEGKRAPGV